MNDKLTNDEEPTGPEAPAPAPDTDGGTDTNGRAGSHSQLSRSQSRRREDEGLLLTRWGYTWRAVTLRIADALAERIATPPTQTLWRRGQRRRNDRDPVDLPWPAGPLLTDQPGHTALGIPAPPQIHRRPRHPNPFGDHIVRHTISRQQHALARRQHYARSTYHQSARRLKEPVGGRDRSKRAAAHARVALGAGVVIGIVRIVIA